MTRERCDTPTRCVCSSDLKGMGETAALANRNAPPLTRGILMRAMDDLCRAIFRSGRKGACDLRIRDDVRLGAGARISRQPKRPGSATVRLADALGDKERSAGEKAGGWQESEAYAPDSCIDVVV